MEKHAVVICITLVTSGCHHPQTQAPPQMPKPTNGVVVPPYFNVHLVKNLECKENGMAVRLAKQSEINKVNARIAKQQQKHWDGSKVTQPVQGLLIRQDGKVGYRIRFGTAVMWIGQALVLDEKVGPPNAAKVVLQRKTATGR